MKRNRQVKTLCCLMIMMTMMSCAVLERRQNTPSRKNGAFYTPKSWYVPIDKGSRSQQAQPAPVASNAPQAAPVAPSQPPVYEGGLEQIREGREGISSWYGPNFHGKVTANGEVYDQHAMTAAHKFLPINSLVRVTNLENGKQVVVRINDRGPYAKGRILDASYVVAQKLGFDKAGTAKVRLDVIQYPNNFEPQLGLDAYQQTVVQLGSFNDEQSALQFKKTLSQRYSSLPLIVDKPLNNSFYVVIGPYNEKDKADQIGASLKSEGVSNIVRSYRK